MYSYMGLEADQVSKMKCLYFNSRNHEAHDAGITCLEVAKDTDGSTW